MMHKSLVTHGFAALLALGGTLVDGAAPARAGDAKAAAVEAPRPAVSVVRAAVANFREEVLLTGTLVPREEILVNPEIEGQRLVEVLADEGAKVAKGDVLARLETATLDAQLAQNDANLARNVAAIAQAESQIVQAEARVAEARNALTRAQPLRQSGYLPEATFDQREAAAKTADAQLVAARDGLNLARAEKALVEAQRQELAWKRSRTEIRAPVDGIISRRTARIGALASAGGDPLFRIIAEGAIELDAEVPEQQLARLKAGQKANVTVAGLGTLTGHVRLVSPEIDRSTRLGRVRVLLADVARPRVGSFARGLVTVAEGRGVAIPLGAVLYQGLQPRVQVVIGDRVATRAVTIGLQAGDQVEIVSGVTAGDLVVLKAGTFLRDGDAVRPILTSANATSEVR